MAAKGIILAGGSGTRLYPATLAVSKQLLPVYDKPMVYYPLTTLIDAGLRDILIISQPQYLPNYKAMFEDGTRLGVHIEYAAQEQPKGIAEAIIIAEEVCFTENAGTICLILGDNLFWGMDLSRRIHTRVSRHTSGAWVFLAEVMDPYRYGVAVFHTERREYLLDIVEKPSPPAPSPYAITGLYIYDNNVMRLARNLKPSPRGELEITDLNKAYRWVKGGLRYEILGPGVAWLDTGTPEALLQAAQYVQTMQDRHGLMIGSPEEAAWRHKLIDGEQLQGTANRYNNQYSQQLLRLLRR